MTSISSIDNNFTTAVTNIDQGIIDAAIISISSSCANVITSIPEHEHFLGLKDNADFNQCHGIIKDKIYGWSSISLFHRVFKTHDPAEERYYFDLCGRINGIDPSSPLGALVHKLSKRVEELGFPCDWIDIRFEKGCMAGAASEWHVDSSFLRSITISYSNKENFSTKVVNKSIDDITKIVPLERNAVSRKNKKIIEPLSEPSLPGVLYNAKNILHRSPEHVDFPNNPLTIDDYRLFFRLRTLSSLG